MNFVLLYRAIIYGKTYILGRKRLVMELPSLGIARICLKNITLSVRQIFRITFCKLGTMLQWPLFLYDLGERIVIIRRNLGGKAPSYF